MSKHGPCEVSFTYTTYLLLPAWDLLLSVFPSFDVLPPVPFILPEIPDILPSVPLVISEIAHISPSICLILSQILPILVAVTDIIAQVFFRCLDLPWVT